MQHQRPAGRVPDAEDLHLAQTDDHSQIRVGFSSTGGRLRIGVRQTRFWRPHPLHRGSSARSFPKSRIDPALPPMPKVKAHHRALNYRDVPAALATIEASGASAAARLCLRFVVLAAVRSGEARGARWREIDDDMRQWRIPGERAKTRGDHRVPLSDWWAPCFVRSGWWISDGGLRRTVVAPTAFAAAQRAPIELDGIVVAVASDAT